MSSITKLKQCINSIEIAISIIKDSLSMDSILPNIKDNTFDPWAKDIYDLSKIDSLSCKVSGMVEEMNESQSISVLKTYTNHIIKSFGPNKIMYGSNWPVCLTKKSYSEVLDIAKKISINVDSEKFFYTNGKNFYLN